MSNAFTNFLSGVVDGVFGSSADLKDYQHANRLFVRNTYARAPKLGFLFFVNFNINPDAILDKAWKEKGRKDVGLLVKKADLPKFKIATETLNQYNRRTLVQSKLTYDPISIEFHDDNSDITLDLWKNYYQYYFADGVYGTTSTDKSKPKEYGDTKFGTKDYNYGLDNYQGPDFFESIDIYVLHKGKGPQDFTQITLLNPRISSWDHDQLSYDDGGKILSNKMSIAYEAVQYKSGKIIKNNQPEGFAPVYYDTAPSPLSIGGGIPGTIFGEGGIVAGAGAIFGEGGSLANAKSPLDFLGVAIQTKNLVKGVSQLSKGGIKTEAYSILGGVLGGIAAGGQAGLAQPGGLVAGTQAGLQQSGFGALGNIGVNLFSNNNSSVNGTTQTTPRNTTGK
jgi:hypothetical protein